MKRVKSISTLLIMVTALLCCLQWSEAQKLKAGTPENKVNAVPLITVINELEAKFDVRFSYNTNLLKGKNVLLPNTNTFQADNIESNLNKCMARAWIGMQENQRKTIRGKSGRCH
ncbi:hypothetical protein [Chitinophaga sp. OAE865]|uniref:hypothetical protein n=1 Tax=Chitinophaga sp. OAE865 TaxID=2817898 RepID=UPI003395D5DF